jgi:hypothetical protein
MSARERDARRKVKSNASPLVRVYSGMSVRSTASIMPRSTIAAISDLENASGLKAMDGHIRDPIMLRTI